MERNFTASAHAVHPSLGAPLRALGWMGWGLLLSGLLVLSLLGPFAWSGADVSATFAEVLLAACVALVLGLIGVAAAGSLPREPAAPPLVIWVLPWVTRGLLAGCAVVALLATRDLLSLALAGHWAYSTAPLAGLLVAAVVGSAAAVALGRSAELRRLVQGRPRLGACLSALILGFLLLLGNPWMRPF